MTFLFLAPLMLGRSLWSPSCLPFLAPIDFLVGFNRLADGLAGEHPHERVHDDVAHAAHIRLAAFPRRRSLPVGPHAALHRAVPPKVGRPAPQAASVPSRVVEASSVPSFATGWPCCGAKKSSPSMGNSRRAPSPAIRTASSIEGALMLARTVCAPCVL